MLPSVPSPLQVPNAFVLAPVSRAISVRLDSFSVALIKKWLNLDSLSIQKNSLHTGYVSIDLIGFDSLTVRFDSSVYWA